MTQPSFRPRPEDRRPRMVPVSEAELASPTIPTVFKVIWNSLARAFHDPVGMVLGSGFVLLMLWGTHGRLELLAKVWPGWQPFIADPSTRPVIIPGLPWDHEFVSFVAGAILLVAVPMVLITRVFKQRLSDYGLGLPPAGRRKFALLSTCLLLALCLPAFYLGAKDPGMQATYPLYRGGFASPGQFVLYQLCYFPFFLAIEFIFRGYLLFGLFKLQDGDAPPGVSGEAGPLVFGYYAVFIAMLSYTAWHLGKPIPELWGTLVWGVAAGTVALMSRSIWGVTLAHWLLNIFLDVAIVQRW